MSPFNRLLKKITLELMKKITVLLLLFYTLAAQAQVKQIKPTVSGTVGVWYEG